MHLQARRLAKYVGNIVSNVPVESTLCLANYKFVQQLHRFVVAISLEVCNGRVIANMLIATGKLLLPRVLVFFSEDV